MNEQQLRDRLEESMEASKRLFDALTTAIGQLSSCGNFPDIDRQAFIACMKYLQTLEDES